MFQTWFILTMGKKNLLIQCRFSKIFQICLTSFLISKFRKQNRTCTFSLHPLAHIPHFISHRNQEMYWSLYLAIINWSHLGALLLPLLKYDEQKLAYNSSTYSFPHFLLVLKFHLMHNAFYLSFPSVRSCLLCPVHQGCSHHSLSSLKTHFNHFLFFVFKPIIGNSSEQVINSPPCLLSNSVTYSLLPCKLSGRK